MIVKAFIAAARSLTTRENLAIAFLGILAAVVTGPFDTHESLNFQSLVLYWSVLILMSFFIGTLVQELVRPVMRKATSWQRIIAYSIGMGLVFAPLCYLWTWLIVPPLDGTLMAFHWFVIDVTLISFAVFALQMILLKQVRLAAFESSESGSVPSSADVPARPLLYRRIDSDDPGPILRIEAMNHFVTVVTPQAEYQLRLRFADAVEQMDGVEGVMTHRSHWVAREAVAGVQRENGRLFLRLKDCTLVPVSRKYRATLDEIGLTVGDISAASEPPPHAARSTPQSQSWP
ncbi:MAG: LytTR family transcriptional regulator [Rhodobacterales bacterium]|nr:LytTR family transcriptional regulator [Rhodobacterales bacterium]MDX5412671.1 LytTR family transcriptional regulator [Rhodobacterales bacterium]